MGKVVTSTGLQDFIETGAVTEVKNHVKGDKSLPGATPVETVAVVAPPPAPPVQPDATAATAPEVPPPPAPEAPAAVVAPDPDELPDPYLGLSDDDKGYILAAPDETERVRRLVGKRHKAMKQEEALRRQAEEEAKDAESFAKNQFERARLAEARATELERELQAAKTQKPAPAPPAAPEPPKAPDIKEFTSPEGVVDWSKFIDAKDQFADARAAHAAEQERAKIAQEKQAEERAKVEAAFRARLEKAQSKYPDFLEVVGATDVLVPDAVLQFITESEYGADITYHMANHADFTDKIRQLSPVKALAEIGKLEATFEKPAAVTPAPTPTPPPAPAVPVVAPAPVAVVPPAPAPKAPERGGAPPPITPISAQGSGTVVTDPSKMDFKQLRAYEREKARSKRR